MSATTLCNRRRYETGGNSLVDGERIVMLCEVRGREERKWVLLLDPIRLLFHRSAIGRGRGSSLSAKSAFASPFNAFFDPMRSRKYCERLSEVSLLKLEAKFGELKMEKFTPAKERVSP